MNIYTISAAGLRNVLVFAADFLSGGIIPLPLMPSGVQRVLNLLPFAAMENIPLRIYSGNISGNEMWFLTGMQILWLTVLLFGGWFWMRAALKKVVVQGG